ncbi:hypothetical protein GCM10012289_05950 [Nonomuraea cavernae]|uniref:Uncharacterized protein n=1 Tax=Nonomuraea cavernae TaxID=2045107 RepID=A0A917YP28_9ACTN|nr:hypothetical protein GCM10012289_05950 [Nonomuraea cavernae]
MIGPLQTGGLLANPTPVARTPTRDDCLSLDVCALLNPEDHLSEGTSGVVRLNEP